VGDEKPSRAVLSVTYTNYRNESSRRRIVPEEIRFGSTSWHSEPQWLLECHDVDKDEHRTFALKDVQGFGTGPVEAGELLDRVVATVRAKVDPRHLDCAVCAVTANTADDIEYMCREARGQEGP